MKLAAILLGLSVILAISVSLGHGQDVSDDSIVLLPDNPELVLMSDGGDELLDLSPYRDDDVAQQIGDARFKRAPVLPKLAVRGLGRSSSSKPRRRPLGQRPLLSQSPAFFYYPQQALRQNIWYTSYGGQRYGGSSRQAVFQPILPFRG